MVSASKCTVKSDTFSSFFKRILTVLKLISVETLGDRRDKEIGVVTPWGRETIALYTECKVQAEKKRRKVAARGCLTFGGTL